MAKTPNKLNPQVNKPQVQEVSYNTEFAPNLLPYFA